MAAPQIVVLDGFSLNPGDLSWAALEALGSLRVYERTAPPELLERAAGASILLTNKTPLDRATLERLPALRYVGVLATGTNIVDVGAASDQGVVVSNVPHYGADSVAEHTLTLMLESQKQLARHVAAVRNGGWSAQPDFSFSVAPIGLLAHKRLGLVGFGAIGQRVSELGRAFKMEVSVASHGSRPLPPDITQRDLDALFQTSDIVSLHCPLTDETRHLVDARRLGLMRPSAVLVNTARGGLVDEAALATALRAGIIAGAYLDVLGGEPPPRDHPLLPLPNCFVTPHIAWASIEARTRLLEIAAANVERFLAGNPSHVVTSVRASIR